jgi:hypothetical protein
MTVNIGDRYSKSDAPTMVWTVSRILEKVAPVPHAILIVEGLSGRQITLSVPALETASMYTKLKAQ